MATYNFVHGNTRNTHHFDGRTSRLDTDFGNGLTATTTLDTRTLNKVTRYSDGSTVSVDNRDSGVVIVTHTAADGSVLRITQQPDGTSTHDRFTR